MLKKILKKFTILLFMKDKLYYLYYRYFVTDEDLLKKKYYQKLNKELNLKEPKLYNEKLQWLKLYWKDEIATICADKYEVRTFVQEVIGEEYLNELIGVYEDISEININNLPRKFVLKGTHGSGFNVICEDKANINWNKELKKMKRWMWTNYYWSKREIVYRDIRPRIICEKFLEQDNEQELRDYRFFCFNGEVKFIMVDFNINEKDKTRRNIYDLEWNLLEYEITYPREINISLEKPKKLKKMIELSQKLTKTFPHARVDFYYIKDKITFGEITFFHQSGLGEISPPEFEMVMGNWIKLPKEYEN